MLAMQLNVGFEVKLRMMKLDFTNGIKTMKSSLWTNLELLDHEAAHELAKPKC